MFGLGVHANYIIGSYVGVAVVVGILIFMVWADSKRQKTRLRQLELAGMRRRGAGTNE